MIDLFTQAIIQSYSYTGLLIYDNDDNQVI